MRADLVEAARRELTRIDANRDHYDRRAKVQQLTRVGLPQSEIAEVVGIHKRQVHRDQHAPPPPEPPRLYNAELADAKRIRELEDSADLVLELAAVLRDEDVAVPWGALCRLNRRKLQELLVIALAAIPVDLTPSELFGWVCDLPAARSAQ